MLQPSPRPNASMHGRHSHSTESHEVAVSIDSGAYDLPGGRPRPRVRHGSLRALLQPLRRRCGGVTLALAAVAALMLVLRASRGNCAAGGASAHALELALAAGSEPVSGADTLRDLIVVAGHAVFTGTNFADAGDQDSWFLEEYQRVPGQVATFLEHMQAGVAAAAANPAAVLLFSGGATRATAGPLSEAVSYWSVANAHGWFDAPAVRDRAYTEEHARDSYENLLFSLCRFHELTGAWPRNVTVVGYEFKRHRFEALHRAAVAFPSERFAYVGTPAATPRAEVGEAVAAASFADDPFGCGPALRAKRHLRDPFARGVPYVARCAAAAPLLRHCGPEPFRGALPWQDGATAAAMRASGLMVAAANALDTTR